MTILQQRPSDVYVQEFNLSQVITSTSSSVACMLIVSKQGTSSKPLRFLNADDFIAEYGNPNASVSFDVYCALDFFKEGNEMWAKRVVGTGSKYSALLMYTEGTGAAQITKLVGLTGGIDNPDDIDWDGIVPSGGGDAVAVFYPNRGQGSYGDNLAISIVSSNIDTPTDLEVVSSTTGGQLVEGTYEYQISALTISSTGDIVETLASNQVNIVISGTGVTFSNTLTWTENPLASGYRIYGRVANAPSPAPATYGLLMQVGQGVGTWTDTGAVTADTTKQPITSAADLSPANPAFTVNVYNLDMYANSPVESFTCTLTQATDDNGQATELTEKINPFSQYMQVVSNVEALLTVPKVTTSQRTNLMGGDSGTAPTNFQIAAAYAVFENKQLYSINTLINAGRADPNVQTSMDALAQKRADCIALLDVPSAQQQWQQAVNYRNLTLNLSSTYSALFNPDMKENDNINGKQLYVPFSGWAAALCARTDRVANPSFSIAGLNRGIVNVVAPRYTFDDDEAKALYQAQVNYTRTFVGTGTALWEQRTLTPQESALSWVSVRRIVNVMKTSIAKFLMYSLQEPNDDFTARQIVGSCTDYLQAIKNARGISSFTVVSDSSNNPAAYLNSAIRVVTVVIVPTLPIHEIQLNMVVSKQGVSFTEALQQVQGTTA